MSKKDLMSGTPKNPIMEGAVSRKNPLSKGKTKKSVVFLASFLALGAGIAVGYGIYLAEAFGPVVTGVQAENVKLIDEIKSDNVLLRKSDSGELEDASDSFVDKTPNYDTATNLFVKGPNDPDTQTGTLQNAADQGYLYSKLDDPSTLKENDLYKVEKTGTNGDGQRLTKTNVNDQYVLKTDAAYGNKLFKATNNVLDVTKDVTNDYVLKSSYATANGLYKAGADGVPTTTDVTNEYLVKADFNTPNALYKTDASGTLSKTPVTSQYNLSSNRDANYFAKSDFNTPNTLYKTDASGTLTNTNVTNQYVLKPTTSFNDGDLFKVTSTGTLSTNKVNDDYFLKTDYNDSSKLYKSDGNKTLNDVSAQYNLNTDRDRDYVLKSSYATPNGLYKAGADGLPTTTDVSSLYTLNTVVTSDYFKKTDYNDTNALYKSDGNKTLTNVANEYIKKPTSSFNDGDLFRVTTSGTALTNNKVNDEYLLKTDLQNSLKTYIQFPVKAADPDSAVVRFDITGTNGTIAETFIPTNSFFIYDDENAKGDKENTVWDLGSRGTALTKQFYFVGRNFAGRFVAFKIQVSVDGSGILSVGTPSDVIFVFLQGENANISTFSYIDVQNRFNNTTEVYTTSSPNPGDYRFATPGVLKDVSLPVRYLLETR